MNVNQYKFTGSDESYTYENLITPLVPLIEEWKRANNKTNVTIWCPFDLDEDLETRNGDKLFKSNYVKVFEERGYKVLCSHILMGKDFFKYEPNEEYDLIISNPPFKNKKLFFTHALELNKPFALVSMASWLNDSGPNNIFVDKTLQLIIPNKRAQFFNAEGCIGKSPSFKSIYFCKDFLINRQIKFIELEK